MVAETVSFIRWVRKVVRSAEKNPSSVFSVNEQLTIGDERILPLLRGLRHHLVSSLSPHLQERISVDDVLQETFVRATMAYHPDAFENDSMCFAWLKKIASNFVIDTINRRRPTTMSDVGGSSCISKSLIDSGQFTASDLLSKEECRQILGLAVEKLAKHHKHVIEQRYFHHKTFEQIAEDTGDTAAAIRGLHRTAINRLKALVGDMSRFYSSRQ